MIEKIDNGLRITGPVLIADAVALLETGRGLLKGIDSREIRVDLSAVEETDSSALAVLFGWLRGAQEQGKTLRFFSPPASMISLASLYSVSETLPLTED